jgi:MarR family transcriptional regulator for hemolysin
MEPIQSVIFYNIEKAIKSYRQFAQKKLKAAGLQITVDQWLTLNSLNEFPWLSQKQLAEKVFKDAASITRIIALLIKAGYVKRDGHADQRRSTLVITPAGRRLIKKAGRTVEAYRGWALREIPAKELETARKVMQLIITNCE